MAKRCNQRRSCSSCSRACASSVGSLLAMRQPLDPGGWCTDCSSCRVLPVSQPEIRCLQVQGTGESGPGPPRKARHHRTSPPERLNVCLFFFFLLLNGSRLTYGSPDQTFEWKNEVLIFFLKKVEVQPHGFFCTDWSERVIPHTPLHQQD